MPSILRNGVKNGNDFELERVEMEKKMREEWRARGGRKKKYSGRTATKGPLPAGPGRRHPREDLWSRFVGPCEIFCSRVSPGMTHWSRFVREPGPMGWMDGHVSTSETTRLF